MVNILLVCALAAVISGGISALATHRFWRSQYAATNKSGDFGTPRGGFIVIMLGSIVGMYVFGYLGPYVFPAAAIAPAMLTSMVSGALAGMITLMRTPRANQSRSTEDKESGDKKSGDN